VTSGIPQLPPLRQIIRRHRLSARRSLGQNFLLDLNLAGRIARAAGPLDGVTILEIGPGPGGLTRALLVGGAARVVAIEQDPRAVGALAELAQCSGERLVVVEADALGFDVTRYLGEHPVRIVSNLPFNISTSLLLSWLSVEPWPPWYEMMILTFQREVAQRIVARPGSRHYGRLSVIAQWRTEPRILFEIGPSAFVPAPKVTAAVVRLVPRPSPEACDRRVLERVTAAAFGQRRKMLRQSLKSLGRDPAVLLAGAGIDPTARAEDVSVDRFAALARGLDRPE
jgi:16S rRNA (adenine1518-N6/adenine1519-N6)-dimethyltransferase